MHPLPRQPEHDADLREGVALAAQALHPRSAQLAGWEWVRLHPQRDRNEGPTWKR